MRFSNPKRRTRSSTFRPLEVPIKANLILHGILIALILIALRAWHLAVIQHEQRFEEHASRNVRW